MKVWVAQFHSFDFSNLEEIFAVKSDAFRWLNTKRNEQIDVSEEIGGNVVHEITEENGRVFFNVGEDYGIETYEIVEWIVT